MNHFGENDRWDTAEFAGLTPAGSTPDGLKWQKIQDINDQEYPKIVNADSHDAVGFPCFSSFPHYIQIP